MAIAAGEPEHEALIGVLSRENHVLISAGTVMETLIVAGRRGLGDEMAALFDHYVLEIVPLTAASARRAAAAYTRWGKGVHQAGLNYGDCFAYEVARTYACPLLYVGNDFGKTDVRSALTANI